MLIKHFIDSLKSYQNGGKTISFGSKVKEWVLPKIFHST